MPDDKLPWWRWGCGDLVTPRDRRNLRQFNSWTFGWAVSLVAASLALTRGWIVSPILVWSAIATSCLLGLAACWMYVRFLREADELLRKIQLEGLAIGFGVGCVFVGGALLAEASGLPRVDPSAPMVAMLAGWSVGQWLAARRYR